jgi:hypothetical protein
LWACFRENWVYNFGHSIVNRATFIKERRILSLLAIKIKQKKPFFFPGASSLLATILGGGATTPTADSEETPEGEISLSFSIFLYIPPPVPLFSTGV